MKNEAAFRPACRFEKIQPSPVRNVMEKASRLEAEGRRVIHFEIGEPDFSTPSEIVKHTVDALCGGETHYAENRGYAPLRKAIAEKLRKDSQLDYEEDEILVTAGVAEGILISLLSFLNPGDEVITFPPCFMNYENVLHLVGVKNVQIDLKEEDGFQPDLSKMKAAINERTRAILLNNPSNPSGVVFGADIIKGIAEVAKEYNLLVISDEIYDKIIFDDKVPLSIGSLEGMKDQTILLNGFSKSHAMTGWRLGYVAANREMMKTLLKAHQYTVSCVNTFTQMGLAAAMLNPDCDDKVKNMSETFEKRRNYIMTRLHEMKNVSFVKPTGGFYLLLNIGSYRMTDCEFADALLEEKGVATVPASGFGRNFGSYIRISYATSMEEIKEGMDRLESFLQTHLQTI